MMIDFTTQLCYYVNNFAYSFTLLQYIESLRGCFYACGRETSYPAKQVT